MSSHQCRFVDGSVGDGDINTAGGDEHSSPTV